MANLQNILHVVSPAAIITFYLAASLWETILNEGDEIQIPEDFESSASPQTDAGTARISKKQGSLTRPQVRQRSIQPLFTLLTGVLYVGEAIALTRSPIPILEPGGAADKNIVFALFSSLVWLILLLSLFDTGVASERHGLYATWVVAVICEVLLFCVGFRTSGQYSKNVRTAQVALQALRIVTELSLVASESIQYVDCEPASDQETAPLLVGDTINAGNKNDTDDSGTVGSGNLQRVRKNWWLYVRGFKVFLPIIRPKTIREFWGILGVCICIGLERVLNVAVPVALGEIVSALNATRTASIPWIPICLYIGLVVLESSAGITLVQGLLWEPIEQRALQSMKRAAYDKLMSLSCDFHDNNKSDVTFQTVQRGTQIIDLVQTIFFDLLPMAIDLVVSISVFSYLFNGYVGFVVGLVVVLYMSLTLKTLSTHQTLWRQYIEIWNSEWYAMTESIKSWDAVSHFGRIPYEMNNFRDKTNATLDMTIRYSTMFRVLSGSSSIVLDGGLAAGACIVAHQVVNGQLDVGKFIVFIFYWGQLSNPLYYFASTFNSITKSLVNAEKLLCIFEKAPTIQNAEDAVPFVLRHGAVDFMNVSFAYDGERIVTNQVTFHAEPGKMIAFVGETGCGKSTLFKLLFRFYDPKEGSICIDGQDIRELTLDSFREHLGIVPQEPALFNKSIRENLRYPDLNATDEEIEEACKAVSLHEKIVSFTKGYDEVIGERGAKLSGGEKQRVAIARAILKNPSILLLDEATSSVDSTTEAQIQASLKALCVDRTTFVIAHRLSTIVNADQIIVMDDGKIVESGTHASLIKQNGPYKKLWTSQLFNHISELRSRSNSRSKCNKEHLLCNDLNSSDEDAKILLAETIGDKGYAITNVHSKEEKQASSHEASHGKQEERGRESRRNDLGGARIASSTVKLPKRAPLHNVLLNSTEPGSAQIHHGHLDDEALQIEHGEEGESVDHDHDLKIPHSSAEAARRRYQSISEPTCQEPTRHDDTEDREGSIVGGLNPKRRVLKRAELSAGEKRNMSRTEGPYTMIGSAESGFQKRCERDRGSEGSRFKLHNGKISGGLKSVALGQNSEKTAAVFVQQDSAGSQPGNGSVTPLLKVPANSPVRLTTSPGGASEDGGVALDSSPGRNDDR